MFTSSSSDDDSDLDRCVFDKTAAAKAGHTFKEIFGEDLSEDEGYLSPDPPPTPQPKKEPTSPPPLRRADINRPKPVVMSADRDSNLFTVQTTVTVKSPPRSPPDAPSKPKSDIVMRRERLLRLQNNLDDLRDEKRDRRFGCKKAIGEFDMNGTLLRTFDSQVDLAKATGIDPSMISRKVNGVNWRGECTGSPRVYTYSSGKQVRFRHIPKNTTVNKKKKKRPKLLKRTPSNSPYTEPKVDKTLSKGDLTPRAHSDRVTKKPDHLVTQAPEPSQKRRRTANVVYAPHCEDGVTCLGHNKTHSLYLTVVQCLCGCSISRHYCLHCLCKAQTKMRKPVFTCYYCRNPVTHMEVIPATQS